MLSKISVKLFHNVTKLADKVNKMHKDEMYQKYFSERLVNVSMEC